VTSRDEPLLPTILPGPGVPGHALLDSGGGRKLERFGDRVLDRPDPQALWSPRLDEAAWRRADLVFVRESDRGGRWEASGGRRRKDDGDGPRWDMPIAEDSPAVVSIRPTPFKHVGLFPEQAGNWAWTAERLRTGWHDRPRLLNLFGYTGAATVHAALTGARVTHVDASRTSLAWMRDNLRASGLAEDAVRVVLEDAASFAAREARRGSSYEGILLDPPHHGRGPKGERWRFEQDVAPLLEVCAELLAPRSFLVLSTYAMGISALALANLVRGLAPGDESVRVEAGELAIAEEPREGLPGRVLPCGFCARWERTP
jgi:23S rRNA (cytosine1962-C5)-methyltransferase